MEERTLMEEIESKIYDLREKLDRLPVGSEEHSKTCDDLSKLYRVFIEHYKAECDMYNQSQKIEHEKEKDEKDLEIKKHLAELDESRRKLDILKIVVPCVTVTGLTIGTCIFESKGHILPTKLLKYVDKIKF